MTGATDTVLHHRPGPQAKADGAASAGRKIGLLLNRLFLSLLLGISGSLALSALFLVAYVIKSMIGIDLIPGWHLTDLFR